MYHFTLPRSRLCPQQSGSKGHAEMPEMIFSDSASLIVLRDATSYRSVASDALSKLSWVFGFDKQLRGSTVYGRAWRNNLKKSRECEEASRLIVPPPEEQQQTGESLRGREFNIILLGISGCSKTTLLKQMLQIIFSNMCELAGALGDELDSEDGTFSPQVQPCSELWSDAEWREWLSRSPDRNIQLS
ncbi:hypothetical protein CHGG_06762 [Chaetomium globosum CBS 148.51]|uniref:Uncharacterized protein n=1 Tax=Chaetomium globosum (strain ATCC 6205 / CBS 148.51 / DSM 1962 / NBRC 6347 / NRRL 1970) TaxID=306901 RepID=Q2H3K3_CHAGB|nr:uncharacterized protein CHGG_06762 [Chaetomium globosum CBS 148.51]EAQ90143.1 hypothetical protein CHGG_06762 [Chaetomium globosum CBS 148.51]